MKQKNNAGIFPALFMVFAFISCNQETKTDEPAKADEKKMETAASPTRDPATDATKVAPGVYRALADTMGIRLLEITARPGESVPIHSHPDNTIYVLEGGTLEISAKDGAKRTLELKTGMGLIAPAESHAAKNTGTTTVRLIVTEIFRPEN